MPWAYERIFKMDITEAVRKAGLSIGDTIPIETIVAKYDGTPLDVSFRAPLIIERPANSDYDVVVFQLQMSIFQPYKVRTDRTQLLYICHPPPPFLLLLLRLLLLLPLLLLLLLLLPLLLLLRLLLLLLLLHLLLLLLLSPDVILCG